MNDVLDISHMGYRELQEAEKLLVAYAGARPDAWWDENVKLAFNVHSGMVFLTNDDYQTLVLRDGKVELFYCLGYDGHEGFIDELYSDFLDGDMAEQNLDELANYLEDERMIEEAERVRSAIHNLKHEEE